MDNISDEYIILHHGRVILKRSEFVARTWGVPTMTGPKPKPPLFRRVLPQWNDAMSDGCSIPALGKHLINVTPAIRAACVRHDERYYYGGSDVDRLRADLEWAMALCGTGQLPEATILGMFAIVRAGGAPEFKQRYSWSFGGEWFQYSPWPAVVQLPADNLEGAGDSIEDPPL